MQSRRPITPSAGVSRKDLETRIARVIARPVVVPADELARIYEPDELGVEIHWSGVHKIERPSTRNDRPRARAAAEHDRKTSEFDVPEQLIEVTLPHAAQRPTNKFDVPAGLLADAGSEEYIPSVHPEPVEIPLAPVSSRSLIPSDILEAIAAEESALLALESPDFDRDDDDALSIDDEHVQLVSEHTETAELAPLLARTQVLKNFPAEALAQLAPGAVRMHLVDRQLAFRQGAPADTFYVVEHGALELVCATPDMPEVALGHVHEAQPFGLFGLLSHRQRTASARAIGDAVIIELSASRLDAVARSFPAARQALARFFKERLLETFLAVSPLFRNLDALGRAALISHFQDRKVAAAEVLLSPGEVQNSITIVTSGEVRLSRRQGPGRDVELAKLHRGEYFGVVSALAGMPTRANIVASEPSTLAVLPQKAFNEFVKGYPILRSLATRMNEAGTQVERDVFVGDATGR